MKHSNHSQKNPQERGKVSTLDILGGRNGNKVRGKWVEHQKRLTDLRDRLMDDRKVHTQNAQEEICNFSEHMADAASASSTDPAIPNASSGTPSRTQPSRMAPSVRLIRLPVSLSR